ncbi:MAG: lipid-A-disaccharide synthase [Flavobacteriales bacterium]|nr:lipid-A-disaccharide synthase [Flavobacteriales bacterium]
MKYFFIAGEVSGDLHASHLIDAIKKVDADATFVGMGGDKMLACGMQLTAHIKQYSFMGFVEVLQNLSKIKRLYRLITSEIVSQKPDKVVLVDYGGFNLKIAKFCKQHGFETHFYILPKVWAWNEKRVKKIKKYVDFGYCIFPFEENYFRTFGINANYVGHPVVEQVDAFLSTTKSIDINKNQVALLPGSREQEIKKMLPPMLEVASMRPNLNFVIAANDYTIEKHLPKLPQNVKIEFGKTFETLMQSQVALVTSGTANLETALLNVPQIVCYKANKLSYAIGKRVVKIKYISPVNLILDKAVIKELIQNDLNAINLAAELDSILETKNALKIKEEYNHLRKVLGNKKAATETANFILKHKK